MTSLGDSTHEAGAPQEHRLDRLPPLATPDPTSKLPGFSRRRALRPPRIDVSDRLLETRQLPGRTPHENIRVAMSVEGDTPDCRADRSQLENALLDVGPLRR
jgi:hypothetical protein